MDLPGAMDSAADGEFTSGRMSGVVSSRGGTLTAFTLKVEIGDRNRFGGNRVGSSVGLAPVPECQMYRPVLSQV